MALAPLCPTGIWLPDDHNITWTAAPANIRTCQALPPPAQQQHQTGRIFDWGPLPYTARTPTGIWQIY